MGDRVAVTGASGFLGGHLTRAATAQGIEVVGFSRSEDGARKVRADGGRPALVDRLDADLLSPHLEGCRGAVHLAHISGERHGSTYDAVNVRGTRALIDACRQAGVPRVVLLSGLGVARYGLARRCTNGYFLSKLASEVELYRSDRQAVVFRPSYIVGPGDAFVSGLLADLARGVVEIVGDGEYRFQPLAVADAVEAILVGLKASWDRGPRVLDLVGPEPLSFRRFLPLLAREAEAQGRPARAREVSVSLEEAAGRAAAGGYRGLLPDELDVILCDEVSDPRPLEALLGRFLTPLADAVRVAVRGSRRG